MTDPKPAPAPAAPTPAAPTPEGTAAAPLPGNGNPRPTDPKTFFKGAKAMDRLKGYLKDVPVLHARLTTVIEAQETHLAASKKSLDDFDAVTAKIQETVERWEADEKEKEGDRGGAGGKS